MLDVRSPLFISMNNKESEKYPCPCCGNKTFDDMPNGSYVICQTCFWEDDPIQLNDPSFKGGANEVSLLEARVNYKKYGVCEERFLRRKL